MLRDLYVVAVFVFAISGPARAGAGKAGAPLLLEPFGARPFSLGQAYAAVGDDAFAMGYNPALLNRNKRSEVATELTRSIGSTQLGYVGFASPLNPTNAIGFSLAYLNTGKAALYDDAGAQYGSVIGEQDLLASLGYARAFDTAVGRVDFGAAGKALRSVLAQQSSQLAYAADFGAFYESTWGEGRPALGFTLANVGPAAGYSGGIAAGNATDPLPLTARLGFGYARPAFQFDRLALGAELDRVFYDDTLFEQVGLEYTYHRMLALRLGYRLGQDAGGGLRIGVGFNIKDFAIDYGVGLMDAVGTVQHFSVNYRFAIPGIRYNAEMPATPLDTLSRRVHASFSNQHFLEAAADIDRIQSVFPDSQDIVRFNRILNDALEEMSRGGETRATYARAVRSYRERDWDAALTDLQACQQAQPDNAEVKSYLARVREAIAEQNKRLQLQTAARTSKLFELANESFENRDYPRAQRILDEILRLGPYQPATSLKARISAAQSQPAPAAPAPLRAKVSRGDSARAEALYYEALRHYAENDWELAAKRLHEALALDPLNKTYQNTLDGIETEFRKRAENKP